MMLTDSTLLWCYHTAAAAVCGYDAVWIVPDCDCTVHPGRKGSCSTVALTYHVKVDARVEQLQVSEKQIPTGEIRAANC
jgi:hypothetical protein